ncbi:MAG TPA: hypothetical protein VHA57_06080 [Actinomycetota bacterium]|nr:hypothetical protein [Actinomycetota bacterium]
MEHQAGWAAFRAGEAPAARAIFAPAHAASPSGETFEGLARTCYLEYEYSQAIELWERAYAAYRDGGDALGSVRVARTLGGMYGQLVGDLAVCAGWISRANSLAAGSPGSPQLGWVALTRGMFEGDRDAKNALFREALGAAATPGGDATAAGGPGGQPGRWTPL